MKRRVLLAAAPVMLATGAAFAQTGTEPLRIVIPLGPSTPSDFATRIVAKAMGEQLKRTIVIDNKPGANGVLAVQEVMRAKPDGNTLMLGGISPMALNMAVVKGLPYDPRRDLTAIGGIYNAFQAWVVSSALPVNSFGEFIAHARKNPGKVTIGHYSALSKIQFAALGSLAGIEMLMVPYKSTMPAINDVMAGTIDASICDVATAVSLAKGGKMKVMAITLAERSALAPGLPTASESIPGMAFPAWSGLVGPAGMPQDVVQKLNAALNASLRNKEVIAALAEQAVMPWETTPEGFAGHVDKEVARWIKLAKDAGVQAE
jgi:tripartite-type tricarboxylate transporter receptor subunit TctC